MSWFSNPFTTSFRSPEAQQSGSDGDEEDGPSPGKGVKEDLSELTKTFSRQLWGVASFLAPPPRAKYRDSSSDDADDEASMAPSAKLQNASSDAGHYQASMAAAHRHHVHIRSSMTPSSLHDVDDEASISLHTDLKSPGHDLFVDEGALSMADNADEEALLHHSRIKRGNHPLLTQGLELSEELVDVDFEGLMEETLEDPKEASKGPQVNRIEKGVHSQSSPHILHHRSSDLSGPNAAHGITGMSRDLAELKGSMTTGFSRILKVVREEVGQEQTFESHKSDRSDDEETADDTVGSTKKLQGINMLLRPLFRNILPHDEGKQRVDASSDDDDKEEVYEDGSQENRTSQISSRAHAFTLHDTFIDGFKGFSDFASSLISVNLHSDDEEDTRERQRTSQAVGITEEVLVFARNISMHPETWLDFPLFSYTDEDGEFEMSVAQKEHVHVLESMVPRLASLRTELCPDCMSEGSFWKIYFILLHSRLHKMDAAILSTPKIMEARELLLKGLQKEGEVQRTKTGRREVSISKGKDVVGMATSIGTSSLQLTSEVQANDFGQLEDIGIDSAEEVQNKSVLVNTIKLASSNYKGDETYTDRWLHEEPLPPRVHSATLASRREEDVSFSDLEEEDEPTSKPVERSDSTHSFGWIQLSKNQSVEDFEGLRASEKVELRGSGHGDGGLAREGGSCSSAQASRKQDQSESSDWSTFEDDDVASADFM